MDSEKIKTQLAQIRLSYLESLSEKKSDIQSHWNELSFQWQVDTYQDLYIIIHGLAGSAGTFDLPDITAHAREIVDLFKEKNLEQKAPDKTVLTEIQAKIDILITILTAAR